MAVCKTRRDALEETHPADTLVLDRKPPGPEENKFLFFKPVYLWCFVMVAQTNTASLLIVTNIFLIQDLMFKIKSSSNS